MFAILHVGIFASPPAPVSSAATTTFVYRPRQATVRNAASQDALPGEVVEKSRADRWRFFEIDP